LANTKGDNLDVTGAAAFLLADFRETSVCAELATAGLIPTNGVAEAEAVPPAHSSPIRQAKIVAGKTAFFNNTLITKANYPNNPHKSNLRAIH
jgi:hypothetical protein